MGYNEVKLDKKSQDLIAFIIFFSLIEITILIQDATNFVIWFIKIVLKILALHLYNWAKFFLNNIIVKRPKTIYNNEKEALGIKRYVFEYIQNLNKILANLEQAGIKIAGTKSQFCQAGHKIVSFISNVNGCYLDILKILKILDWPKWINILFVYAFIGVYVYYWIWIKDFA